MLNLNVCIDFRAALACKEVKNGLFGLWACSMISSKYFRTISQEHLGMGHTHEDIGFLADELGMVKFHSD